MQTPLVVFIPKKEREALRSSGVLPPSWFETYGSALWNGRGNSVYLWPNDPDYGSEFQHAGNPPPPARLLGLETKGDEWMRSENLVAKLFGATVVHVLFLDEEEVSKPGFVDVTPLIALVRWVKALGESIRTWFADTQNRNIRHVVVVVARKGHLCVTDEQLCELRREFSDAGAVKTCYLVSSRLEVGLGHDALHAAYLWPIIVGRLLLRMLIELSRRDSSGGVFIPGVHLVRSFEYLIDCPAEEIGSIRDEAQREIYKVIHLETSADGYAERQRSTKIVNHEQGVFPGLNERLSDFLPSQGQSKGGRAWHLEDVQQIVALANDDSRWDKARKRARANFAECERKMFLEKERDRVMEAREIFSSVAKDPGNIRIEERKLQDELPSDTCGADVIYEKWLDMVRAEQARKNAQKRLEDGGREMARAQNHYVTAPYGILAVVATSLFCGYALVRMLWAVCGNGGLTVAVVLSSFSAGGALLAWLLVSYLHRKAGSLAMDELKSAAEEVGEKMDARHVAAVGTVRTAETRHSVGLKRGRVAVLQRLLGRIGRIVDRELQSPTAEVFYRSEEGDGSSAGSEVWTKDDEGRQDEVAIFKARTRFAHSLPGGAGNADGRLGSNVERVIGEAFRESGENSFRAFWKGLCAETDGMNQQGNFPAKVFIPRIREWFRNLGGKLVMAQKKDLIESAQKTMPDSDSVAALPEEFLKLRGDSGFALASADVELAAVNESPREFFLPKDSNIIRQVNGKLKGGGGDAISVCETDVLNGLPQAAFFFQDIRVCGIGRGEDGRLMFTSKYGNLVDGSRESGVA